MNACSELTITIAQKMQNVWIQWEVLIALVNLVLREMDLTV